jgi:hypothetical protein
VYFAIAAGYLHAVDKKCAVINSNRLTCSIAALDTQIKGGIGANINEV